MVNRQHSVIRDVGLPATGDFDIEFTVEMRGGSEERPFGLRRFGDDYRSYMNRTWRFIPRIG